MANFSVTVTKTPTAIPGLIQDVKYAFQNRGPYAVYVEVAASAPDTDSLSAFIIPPLEFGVLQDGSDDDVYVWTISGDDGKSTLAMNEG